MTDVTQQDAGAEAGRALPPAFYVAEGDAFAATEATQGPWSPDLQHGGPVAALLTRALEEAAPEGGHLARVAVDLLRPVPVAAVRTSVRVLRPGRSVALLEAELHAAEGPVRARATAWWRRRAPASSPTCRCPPWTCRGPRPCRRPSPTPT